MDPPCKPFGRDNLYFDTCGDCRDPLTLNTGVNVCAECATSICSACILEHAATDQRKRTSRSLDAGATVPMAGLLDQL